MAKVRRHQKASLVVKLLTLAVMVDTLAKMVDERPLNWGHYVLFVYNWEHENCQLYGVAGCPLFRGVLKVMKSREK